MGDYADWAIEDSIWGDPIEGKRKRSYPRQIPNPPRVRFRGKTPKQYLEFINIPAGDWDNILLQFEEKYPSNGVPLRAKFGKDKGHLKQSYWGKFMSYCQQFKPS